MIALTYPNQGAAVRPELPPQPKLASGLNETFALIELYFSGNTAQRNSLVQLVGRSINTPGDVLHVLNLATQRKFQNSYDGAAHLLGASGWTVLDPDFSRFLPQSTDSDLPASKKWQILIRAIVASYSSGERIPQEIKVQRLEQYLCTNNSIVSNAIVNGLGDLLEECPTECSRAKIVLRSLANNDNFPRQVRREAADLLAELGD